MKDRVGTIKNPLSVIAIFAGIAEISGTAVLPHIDPANQELYIWFLMSFPFTLVILFFGTLNWNHRVLYAPSDFKDEDNFVNLLHKATYSETLQKIKEEVEAEEDGIVEDLVPNSEKKSEKLKPDIKDLAESVQKSERKLSAGEFTTKEEREAQRDLVSKINRLRIKESLAAEDLIIRRVERDLGILIQRDMKFESERSRFMFDGVAIDNSTFTAIEVKMLSKNTMNSNYWLDFKCRLNEFYNGLSESQKNKFSLIYAVATDSDKDEMEEFIKNKLRKLEFPLAVKVYQFDELTNENPFNKRVN